VWSGGGASATAFRLEEWNARSRVERHQNREEGRRSLLQSVEPLEWSHRWVFTKAQTSRV
jgi:hypothetical protein